METGPRSAGSSNLVDPYIPPVILKAIGWIKTGTPSKGWAQACPSVPHGGVGQALVSHDFGYGIMQITSGMESGTAAVPTLDQVMIGGHYGFNIARGAQILLEKWNAAPSLRPIVGGRNPSLVEDWYYAIWSYNGFAFPNHPQNPILDVFRAPYRCDGRQSRSGYPYQELVFGCIANPPVVNGVELWEPIAVTLPDRNDPAFDLSAWIACTGSFDCAAMDLSTPQPSHNDPTVDPTTVGGSRTDSDVLGSPVAGVSPTSVNLIVRPGEQSSLVTVIVSNSGTGPLVWRLSPSVSWVSLSPIRGVALGTDIGSQASAFTFFADTANLGPGIHSGKILVISRYPLNTAIEIDITLTVLLQSVVPGLSKSYPTSCAILIRGGCLDAKALDQCYPAKPRAGARDYIHSPQPLGPWHPYRRPGCP